MRIKSIKLKNFLSFGNVNLNLIQNINDDPTLYVIDGINYDNDSEDASNGSGKSALIGESITYNIYGKGLRGTRTKVRLNDMIKYGCQNMFNEVEYLIETSDGPKSLVITRSKQLDGASTVNVSIDGEEKTKRTKQLSDKDIKLFINILPEVFSQVIIYYRDNINLLSMNYGQRLDFFKNVIDLSLIDDYYNKIKDFKNMNDRFLDKLTYNYKNTKEIIDIVDENRDKYKIYLESKLNELYNELKILESKKFEDTESLETKLSELDKQLGELDKVILDCQSNITYTRKNMDKLEKELKKIDSLVDVECPTCKQYVPKKHIDSISERYKNELNTLSNELNKLLNNLDQANAEKRKINKDKSNLKEKIDKINNAKILNKQNIKNIKIEINKLENEIKELQNTNNDTVDKNKYEKRLEAITRAINIRNNWKQNSEYWYNLFAPKSLLRSAIIRRYINVLSDIFEYYVSKLYNNEILSKIEIDDDGQIDILLYKDNFETNYWQMSSGERKRIDIAMMFSLYEFTSYLNPNIPRFLILDEIFDSLDYPGIRAVTEALLDVQQRHKVDLFVISHIPLPLEDLNTSTKIKHILVTKRDKTSVVESVS